MATLILTAVGTAVAGPIGGMIGSLAGQQIDSSLFAPKLRRGPRLGELSVQTSSYGSQIPKLFGIMRVAGTVIWATDLREAQNRSGGGKGRPSTVTYSYSASFAVALSGRRIRGIRRIWADGKLLRGAAGDFKSETKFRLYLGREDQPVDPLIGSAEGANRAPAYRGLAYAVFEQFQLADYGNRIPSLTFEVDADEGDVTIGAIAAALSDGMIVDAGTPGVTGYAGSGDSIRAAVEDLAEATSLSLTCSGEQLIVSASSTGSADIALWDSGARGVAGSGGRTQLNRRAANSMPFETSIAYYDVDRDFQSGLQRARRAGAGDRTGRHALPVALSASAAKGLAERRLRNIWAGRESGTVHLAWRRSDVRPGALARLEGEQGLWRVVRWTLDRMVVSLDLRRISAAAAPVPEASPGRPISEPDLIHGRTTLFLFDLPIPSGQAGESPQIVAITAGRESGWRRAALLTSTDGGQSWAEAGQSAAPAMMGHSVTRLAAGGSALLDMHNVVDVELLNGAMWLEGRSDAALAEGANLAVLGDELIQFGEVEPLGGRRFRLSRLLRGRRGTEWATGLHVPGEPFALLEGDRFAAIELNGGSVGGEIRVMASGVGDDEDVVASLPIGGRALQPPSPVHLQARPAGNADLEISWVRRSRFGWNWPGGSDTPLGEERERYQVTFEGGDATRDYVVAEPRFVYPAAERAAALLTGPLTMKVAQIGTHAVSRAAQITIDH